MPLESTQARPDLCRPVLELGAGHRAVLLGHFLDLDAEDRRLRFGIALSREGIVGYVSRLDFQRDAVFGVFARDRLAAVAHLALGKGEAELGISVLPPFRGAGIGNALLRAAVDRAEARGAARLHMHCLAENRAMLHLARKNGMQVCRHAFGEADGWIELEPTGVRPPRGAWHEPRSRLF